MQSYFNEKLPDPEELAELFAAHIFEVESVEPKGDDHIFDVKVLPDRAHYLLSHKGAAREIRAILGTPIRPSADARSIVRASKNVAVPEVRIENPEFCRRYMARRVENISSAKTPKWLRERFFAIGQKSINPFVDMANYVMFDIGQPLHVFDADKVNGAIIVRLAKDSEEVTVLTGEKIILTKNDLVIADNDGILGIAGVKGGKRAEVTADTKAIIIEAAHFDPVAIRRTATRLNLRTDASKRFENEITPARAEEGMGEISVTIFDYVEGAELGDVRDEYLSPVTPWEVRFSASEISSVLGAEISAGRAREVLERMDIKVIGLNGTLTATPPLDRLDVAIQEDIADEVGRIQGYDKIKSVMPPETKSAGGGPDKEFFYTEKIKNILIGRGYSEVLLYSLVPKGAWEVIHPLSPDKAAAREHLAPKLIKSLKMNVLNADLLELDRVKVFEIGHVFLKDGEKVCLALVVSKGSGKLKEAEEIIRADFAAAGESLGVNLEPKFENDSHGLAGECDLSPFFDKLPGLKNISELGFSPSPRTARYKPFSPYPFISRDIALFVGENDSAADVIGVIKKHAGEFLVSLRLFDEFIKDGKKSFAFRLVFQSMERTLTDKEVSEIMREVAEALEKNKNWSVR